MVAMSYLLIAVYLGILGFIVYRQFATQRIRQAGLLVFPALLAFGTVQTIGRAGIGPIEGLLLAAGLLVGAGTGYWRGHTYRIWTDASGQAWQRGTWMTLASWGLLIALRVVFAVAAGLLGLHLAQLGADVMASLFGTFAAQNAVIHLRTRPRPIIRASAAG